MRRLRLLAFLPLALLLSGCFQIFSTLTIRSDGSAQIVERITAEGAMAMGLMMMDEIPGDGRSSFERRADRLGEGVTFVSVEEEVVPGQITYIVTYDVADVNELVYAYTDAVDTDAVGESIMGGGMTEDPSMEGAMPCDPDVEDCEGTRAEDPGMDDEGTIEDDGETPYRFAFTPASAGRPAALQVIVPEGGAGPGDLDMSEMGRGAETEEDSYKQALVLIGTMSMHFEVRVDGALVGTDRGWTHGNTVTLSSVQMGELLTYAQDEIVGGNVDDFIARQDPTVDVDLPGLRYVAPGTVTVQFR